MGRSIEAKFDGYAVTTTDSPDQEICSFLVRDVYNGYWHGFAEVIVTSLLDGVSAGGAGRALFNLDVLPGLDTDVGWIVKVTPSAAVDYQDIGLFTDSGIAMDTSGVDLNSSFTVLVSPTYAATVRYITFVTIYADPACDQAIIPWT